jgi:RNA polymerase sigma factor (sigma-70 family)
MPAAREFPITSWTLVLSAGQRNDTVSSNALASLCEKYWFPLYAYIRRRGYSVEQAQDLTQEFFARVLEKRYLERADRNKGRFRSFLLSSLRCFLSDDADHRQALKRGGPLAAVPFEVRDGEEIYQREPCHNETPERVFERRWAVALLEQVLAQLRNEFVSKGQAARFERLRVFLSTPEESAPYAELAREWQTTEGALKVAIHRLRKRYREVLRAEIAETVSGPGEIEAEIRYLASTLAASKA